MTNQEMGSSDHEILRSRVSRWVQGEDILSNTLIYCLQHFSPEQVTLELILCGLDFYQASKAIEGLSKSE